MARMRAQESRTHRQTLRECVRRTIFSTPTFILVLCLSIIAMCLLSIATMGSYL